jgi:hypothetical protein
MAQSKAKTVTSLLILLSVLGVGVNLNLSLNHFVKMEVKARTTPPTEYKITRTIKNTPMNL